MTSSAEQGRLSRWASNIYGLLPDNPLACPYARASAASGGDVMQCPFAASGRTDLPPGHPPVPGMAAAAQMNLSAEPAVDAFKYVSATKPRAEACGDRGNAAPARPGGATSLLRPPMWQPASMAAAGVQGSEGSARRAGWDDVD